MTLAIDRATEQDQSKDQDPPMNAQSSQPPSGGKDDADSDHSSREFSNGQEDYRIKFKLVQTENAARKSLAADG